MSDAFKQPSIFTEYQLLKRLNERFEFFYTVALTHPSLSKLLARSMWRMALEMERRGLLQIHAERIRQETSGNCFFCCQPDCNNECLDKESEVAV